MSRTKVSDAASGSHWNCQQGPHRASRWAGKEALQAGSRACLRMDISTVSVPFWTGSVGWQWDWAPWVVLVPPLPSHGLPFAPQQWKLFRWSCWIKCGSWSCRGFLRPSQETSARPWSGSARPFACCPSAPRATTTAPRPCVCAETWQVSSAGAGGLLEAPAPTNACPRCQVPCRTWTLPYG